MQIWQIAATVEKAAASGLVFQKSKRTEDLQP